MRPVLHYNQRVFNDFEDLQALRRESSYVAQSEYEENDSLREEALEQYQNLLN